MEPFAYILLEEFVLSILDATMPRFNGKASELRGRIIIAWLSHPHTLKDGDDVDLDSSGSSSWRRK